MKQIISKALTIAPYVIGIMLIAYILEELLEDFVNETVSDFVYPLAGLIILLVVWKYLIPTIKAHLEDTSTSVQKE